MKYNTLIPPPRLPPRAAPLSATTVPFRILSRPSLPHSSSVFPSGTWGGGVCLDLYSTRPSSVPFTNQVRAHVTPTCVVSTTCNDNNNITGCLPGTLAWADLGH
ncbi:hypothetical protein E2C01_097014 [Portunus trituberculatus]|uniref:Uncharacterized protein n=1 Tax=Portunus trituberculatus TaxID=210409 RepID=A0A5B7JU21_PORTR|nr:hypothetical protein [Portunus trituberculatus]